MKNLSIHRRAALCGLAVVVLTAALFGAFGHADHAGAHHQPCAACVVVTLLVTAVVATGISLGEAQQPRAFARISVARPRTKRFVASRAERAPPSA